MAMADKLILAGIVIAVLMLNFVIRENHKTVIFCSIISVMLIFAGKYIYGCADKVIFILGLMICFSATGLGIIAVMKIYRKRKGELQ